MQTEYDPRGGIIITENGVAVREEGPEEALKDIERAVYLKRYLAEVGGRVPQGGGVTPGNTGAGRVVGGGGCCAVPPLATAAAPQPGRP